MEGADCALAGLAIRHPGQRGGRRVGGAPKRRAKCALRGEACDGCFGEDGDAVGSTVPARRPRPRAGRRRATEGGKADAPVEAPTNVHRTSVESNGIPHGRGRSA